MGLIPEAVSAGDGGIVPVQIPYEMPPQFQDTAPVVTVPQNTKPLSPEELQRAESLLPLLEGKQEFWAMGEFVHLGEHSVPVLVKARPELADVEPFKTVMSGDREAIARLPIEDLEKILALTLTGMSVDEFRVEVAKWFDTARDPRWKRPYTELVYKPMQEVLQYLRANAFRTYIVTGGGQDFVRVYAERVYGIPPEQIVGTAGATKYDYGKDGKPVLIKEAKLLLNDNYGGKPEGIHLMIGRRPLAAVGNSTGDREMLEYAKTGTGARLSMLLLHDDAAREYAYGPAQGLPESKVGTFTQQLYDEAKRSGWTVISMKNDWKRIFAFE